jgi:hypothetical protein
MDGLHGSDRARDCDDNRTPQTAAERLRRAEYEAHTRQTYDFTNGGYITNIVIIVIIVITITIIILSIISIIFVVTIIQSSYHRFGCCYGKHSK